MDSKQLITQYEERLFEERKASADALNAKISTARTLFENNCKLYLGDLLSELSPSLVECSVNSSKSLAEFTMDVSFMTIAGTIKQTYRIASDTWDAALLDFGIIRISQDEIDQVSATLPTTDFQLGAILSILARYVLIRDARYAQAIEQKKAQFINLLSRVDREQGVVDLLNAGIEEFPDEAELFQTHAREAAERIQKVREVEYKQQLADELAESERAQLKRMADYAWRKPFEVFMLRYGVCVEETSEDEFPKFVTDTFFTLTDTADKNGYFQVYEKGELKKNIKPQNILSIERVKITGKENVPFELKRSVLLQSKSLPDVKQFVYLPPLEFFAFDYDAIKLALEVEETADDEAKE